MIFDVVENLQTGDVILNGPDLINRDYRQAAVPIAHPKGGTTPPRCGQRWGGARI